MPLRHEFARRAYREQGQPCCLREARGASGLHSEAPIRLPSSIDDITPCMGKAGAKMSVSSVMIELEPSLLAKLDGYVVPCV